MQLNSISKFAQTRPSFTQEVVPKNTNVKVHKGFNLYYTDYGQYLIQKENQDIFEEADNIVITGHSLGGAVATIAFMDLNAQYKDNKDSKLKVSYYTTVFLTLFWQACLVWPASSWKL